MNAMGTQSNIVSVAWLAQHLFDKNLIVLDATMKKMPNGTPVDQAAVYIEGALEFNFDTQICDQKTDLPHMLPTPEEFETAVRQLGINKSSTVVVYDAMGIFSSPRAWWMFKVMGHNNVRVLDGGLPKWLASNLAVQTVFSVADKPGNFKAQFNSSMVFNADQVLSAIGDPAIKIIDARSQGRFNGTEPEPRTGLRAGHIPNSSCIPFSNLLADGLFKSQQQMKEYLAEIVKDDNQHCVFSCGSGVTASVLALAAEECGYSHLSVYDGSWSEWGSREDLPVEK